MTHIKHQTKHSIFWATINKKTNLINHRYHYCWFYSFKSEFAVFFFPFNK